jgi:hypothetical protein
MDPWVPPTQNGRQMDVSCVVVGSGLWGVDPWAPPAKSSSVAPRTQGDRTCRPTCQIERCRPDVTVKNGTPNGHWGFWKRMCTKLNDGLVTIFGQPSKMDGKWMCRRHALGAVCGRITTTGTFSAAHPDVRR